MKINIFTIFVLLTLTLFAELPPQVYENYQKNAPEVLTIKVQKVEISLISLSEKKVVVNAKVLEVQRSRSKLKVGKEITIIYHTTVSRPSGWVGPSPLSVLVKKNVYDAFLIKNKENNYFSPAARGKSFR